jgi:phage shock protein A
MEAPKNTNSKESSQNNPQQHPYVAIDLARQVIEHRIKEYGEEYVNAIFMAGQLITHKRHLAIKINDLKQEREFYENQEVLDEGDKKIIKKLIEDIENLVQQLKKAEENLVKEIETIEIYHPNFRNSIAKI